ncbi:MAG TPA: hypothetical protein VGP93_15495 [Polyangiaceae bacterium]|nr:hypothetical protein [Polyangiaceae bacterium]
MKANAILLASAALALAACATTAPPNDVFAARHVVPGVSTRADVDKLLGTPYGTVTVQRTKGVETTYGYTDVWGYAMALFVTYDDKGVVVTRYAMRRSEN